MVDRFAACTALETPDYLSSFTSGRSRRRFSTPRRGDNDFVSGWDGLRSLEPSSTFTVCRRDRSAHFDDMGADELATYSTGGCNPVMAVENVVLAAPCVHLYGWKRLALSHCHQDAAQS